MPILQADFKDVPDKMLPIPSGIHKFLIKKVELKPTKAAEKGEDPGAMNLVCEHVLQDVQDEALKDRTVTRYLSTKMKTEIKRLALSCGIARDVVEAPGGFDTDLLVEKTCLAEVNTTVDMDKTTNIQKEYSNINGYLIPGDPAYKA